MCSSMLLVVQSTIMTPSMVRGSAPSPTTISFVLTRSWAAAAADRRDDGRDDESDHDETTRPAHRFVSLACWIGWGP